MTRRPRALPLSALDFRLGLRILARYPGLTVVSVIAIAVAIALSSVYFEGVSKWQNPVLDVPDADRIVAVHQWDASANLPETRTLNDYATWRAESRSFDVLGAAITFQRNLATEDGTIEPVNGAEITANAFAMMGTSAALGRTLIARDELASEPPVLVIGHALWKARFNSDPSVIGRTVKLGTSDVTIVGVMPEGFAFPVNQRAWTALRADGAAMAPRSGPSVTVFARLGEGVTIDAAQSELGVIAARVAASSPATHEHLRPMVLGYGEPISAGQMLMIRNVLYGVNVVFVLLLIIICANVAALLFARSATRGWEMTVRTALGASRGRIVLQLFIEALGLVAVGTTVGLIIARIGLGTGIGLLSGKGILPFWIDAGLSWRTITWASLLTLAAAAMAGILPALRVTRVNVQDALRNEGAARSTLKFGGLWTAVIVGQVAITVAFMPIVAGGVYESNRFSQRAEGIGGERFLTADVSVDREDHALDSAANAMRARATLAAFETALTTTPGVEHVAFADRLPVEDQFKYGIAVDTLAGAPVDGHRRSTLVHVSPGFFATFGTGVVTGRDFAPLDFETGNVIIVNEAFVHHVLLDRNPIGQRVQIVSGEDDSATGEQWYEIVGMVRNFGWQLPLPSEQSAMYRPVLPGQRMDMKLAVRVADPEAFATELRRIAASTDATIRLEDVQHLGSVGGGEAAINWTLTWIASLVSAVVLMLSATGIHALMSFTVARRTREIGIRAALGASPALIVRGIFGRAFLQISAGVILGSGLVWLRGVGSSREVMVLLGADLIMLTVGLIACWVPLRRALSIDPTEALRAEG